MSVRDEYTAEEWKQIVTAPAAIIAAVIGVSPGGPIQIGQEVGAAVKAFERAAEELASNPLLAAVLVELKGRFEAYIGKAAPEDVVEFDIMALAKDPAAAAELCRSVVRILAAKAPAEQGEPFRRWLLTLAEAVAEAGKEGGFMGIGGEAVSPPERELLGELAAALEVAG